MKFDLLIKNGKIIDGTGNPWFKGDIGIKNGKIIEVGRISPEKKMDRVIDARGLIVAPGFIDMHAHDDLMFFRDIYNKPKLFQGVTTVVVGNCGTSPAPVNKKTLKILKSYLGIIHGKNIDFDWFSYGEYLNKLESLGNLGTNFVGLVGHGTLRIAVMGMNDRNPTEKELKKMKKLVSQSMNDGAFGVSSGLIYPPGVYSKAEELVELLKDVAKHGGIYSTHIRDEADHLFSALDEAIRIVVEAKVPVEISHHKAAGKSNWGKIDKTLKMIEEARKNGVDITVDAYPYLAGASFLGAILPPFAHEGGEEKLKERCKDPKERGRIKEFIEEKTDWQNFIKQTGCENIVLAYSPNYPEFIGKNILEISKKWNKSIYDTIFEIIANDGADAEMIIFMMNGKDLEKVISCPYTMIGTDGVDKGIGIPHPRTYGTFPRILGVYVRDRKLLNIEEAIRKMTSFPAQKIGLKDRGLVKEGFWADIVVFDADGIIDKATYKEPRNKPEGIEYVIVNGVISVEKGDLTGKREGKVLKKNNYLTLGL